MFVDITAIAVVALVASSQGNEQYGQPGLVGKWSKHGTVGVDSFFPLPQTLETAASEGWTEITGCEFPDGETGRGYKDDPTVILIYNEDTGKVIGFQGAISAKKMAATGVPIDYTANPHFTVRTLNEEVYYTSRAYWSNVDDTEAGTILIQENGAYTQLPANAWSLPYTTNFYAKGCITFMGEHYYTINSTTNCQKLLPWGIIAVGKQVMSISFAGFGGTTSAGDREWFEDLGASEAAHTVPGSADCVLDYFGTYGYTTFHLYFIEDPDKLECISGCVAEYSEDAKWDDELYLTPIVYDGGPNVCPLHEDY